MDYESVEIPFLAFLLLFGFVGSFLAANSIWTPVKCHNSASRRQQFQEFLILQRNLNIGDIIVLIFYVTRELIDKLNDRVWIFGAFMCGFTHFLGTYGLHLGSNIIVCIAIYRVSCVLRAGSRPNQIKSAQHKIAIIVSLTFCHLLAAIVSAPQMSLWSKVKLEVQNDNQTFNKTVCTTMWFEDADNMSYSWAWVNTYNIIHTTTISLIPSAVIIISYVVVTYSLSGKLTQNLSHTPVSTESLALFDDNSSHLQQRKSEARLSQTSSSSSSFAPPNRARIVVVKSFLLVMVYFISWTPYNIAVIWSIVDEKSFFKEARVFKFTWHFIALSCVLNPFIYKFCSFPCFDKMR